METLSGLNDLLDFYITTPMTSKSAKRVSDLKTFFVISATQITTPLPEVDVCHKWMFSEYMMRKRLSMINLNNLKKTAAPKNLDSEKRATANKILKNIIDNITILQQQFAFDEISDICKIDIALPQLGKSDIFDI